MDINPLTEPLAFQLSLDRSQPQPTELCLLSLTEGSYQKVITDGQALGMEWRGQLAASDAGDPRAAEFVALLESHGYAVKWACRTWGYSMRID